MKSSDQNKVVEQGRAIARAMSDLKVEKQKNMAKAVKRRETMLHIAADQALSGK